MRLLLDTQILIWWLSNDKRLPSEANQLIRDPDNEAMVSVASIWEMAIKLSLGKIKLPIDDIEASIAENCLISIPVNVAHAVQYSKLKLHHRDPFDRMLIAQSIVEPAYLLTTDTRLSKYGSTIMIL